MGYSVCAACKADIEHWLDGNDFDSYLRLCHWHAMGHALIKLGDESPAVENLEKLGYLVSTETDNNKILIRLNGITRAKIEGLDLEHYFFCGKPSEHLKKDGDEPSPNDELMTH